MTNQEMFEVWWNKAKHTLKCEYYDAFEIWQAATQREGYKFVPVEPTEMMIDKGLDCEHDIDDWVVVAEIYKAMIGAAP